MLLRFLHKVPTFRLLLPYVFGVMILASHLKLAWSLMLLGIWGYILYSFLERKLATAWSVRWMPGICIFCFWISLGAFSSGFELNASAFPSKSCSDLVAMVRIETVPVEKPKTFQCQVCILKSENKAWKGKQVQLYIAKDVKSGLLKMGDCLMVSIKPQKPESRQSSGTFDYVAWLHNMGICGTAYVPVRSWRIHSRASVLNIKVIAERMRSFLLERFKSAGISGDEFSMVSALALGSVNLLTPETKQQFSVSGVSHILSVSGLHVAVVYAILEFLLSFFNRFEKLKVSKQIIIILVLWCYAFMTGLSPSVIRSAFMFSLLALGHCLHRKSQTINTVLFSAFVLLVWNPSFLFNLGFELSYCAVLSIVVVHARLKNMWTPASKITGYFWEMICLSVVAQLGTAPLTIYYFHQFPNYFLLNNLVAVPASGLIIYLACAFLLLGEIPYFGFMLTWCLNGSLSLFQRFVKTSSEWPHALTEHLEISKMEVWVLYLLMGSLFIWFFLKRKKWIIAVLFFILCLQGLALSQYFKMQKSTDLCQMSVNSYICEKRNPCLQKLLQKTRFSVPNIYFNTLTK